MPVYKCKLRSGDDVVVVRASSASKARDHLVAAEAINAEDLCELIAGGAKVETAVELDPVPAETKAGDKANLLLGRVPH